MKKLLMLTAKETEIPFILQAKMMGYFVITTGNDPSQVGHKYGDQYIPFDYSDYEGITELARRECVDAVMAGCSDNCVLTAAYICDHLNIKGHDTYEITEIIHRKDKFKDFALEYNIRTPQARKYLTYEKMVEDIDELFFPIIVKPSDMAGGKGVSVVYGVGELEKAVNKALDISRTDYIVAEPFIEGTLHSLHVLLVDEKVRAYGTANDYSYKNKFMTSYGLFPADNWEQAVEVLLPEIERIAHILHLVDGQLDAQYIMSDDGPWIIEMMRRHPGNHTTSVISHSIGVNWKEWILKAEAGESIKCAPFSRNPNGYYGYYAVMGDHNGIYDGFEIAEEIKQYIYQIDIWKEEGDMITDYLYDKMALIQFGFPSSAIKDEILPHLLEKIKVKYK